MSVSDAPPRAIRGQDIVVVPAEDMLRNVGTVEEWCLRHGTTEGHEENFSAKVARIITLGCSNNRPLPRDILEAVPQATRGSWWITETAVDGHDLETYRRLANHAENFREHVWRQDRKQKWSKYKLEVVEAGMRIFRLFICLEHLDREDALLPATGGA